MVPHSFETTCAATHKECLWQAQASACPNAELRAALVQPYTCIRQGLGLEAERHLLVRQAPVLDASACPAGVQRPPAPCGAGLRAASPPGRSLCADAGSALPPYFRWSSLHAQEHALCMHPWCQGCRSRMCQLQKCKTGQASKSVRQCMPMLAMLWPLPSFHSNRAARLARALSLAVILSLDVTALHLSEGLREAAETELQRPEPGEPAAGCCARAAAAPYLPCSASSASAVRGKTPP